MNSKVELEKLAASVVRKLAEYKLDAVLVGGSVVSLYTHNKYASFDLDFISSTNQELITAAMAELGFHPDGRHFVHPDCPFTIEFPSGPIALGNTIPVKPEGELTLDGVRIKMLSPTQSIMDRLASFLHWDDRQCLDQAVWIAEQQPFNMEALTKWAERENQPKKFQVFLNRLKK